MATTDRKLSSRTTRNDVRMDGVFFYRASLEGAFVKTLEPGNVSHCVMVRRGHLRLELDFPVPTSIELGPGDAVAVSGLATHLFKSGRVSQHTIAKEFDRLPLDSTKAQREIELIVGSAPNEALALGSLMIGPIHVKAAQYPDLSRRLWRAVEMIEDEYADDNHWVDRNLVIRRLAEIMLVNMSRRALADGSAADNQPGATAQRQILHAINAFFEAPEKVWTLRNLAHVAGMSRTRFAEEFRLVTGQTPARIISRLRLTAIAHRLSSAAISIEAAAEEAGYGSSAAFVRAFQREFGETPARWRRDHGSRSGPSRKRNGRRPALRSTQH
jgi:AraC-like DNA-binding protein